MGFLDHLPQFSTSFCGKSTKTGSLFIGWYCTIMVGVPWTVYLASIPSMYSAYRGFEFLPRWFICMFGLASTYLFIPQILLLHGVIKKKCNFLLAWIVMTTIWIVLATAASFILFIMVTFVSPMVLFFLIPINIINGIMIYFFLVITSYYKEIIKENNKNKAEPAEEPTVDLD